MPSELSLEEMVAAAADALHASVAARVDGAAVLATLKEHGVFSYENLGDSLTGAAAEPLLDALLRSAPLIFFTRMWALYYAEFVGVPRGLADAEEQAILNEQMRADENTLALRVAARLAAPRQLRPRAARVPVAARSPRKGKKRSQSSEPPATAAAARRRSAAP